MEVIFRKRFQNKLDRLLRYISDEFGEKGLQTFTKALLQKLATIKKFPESGQPTMKKDIRSVIAGKHIVIYYKLEKSTIVILNMYDMRMNPEKNPYKKANT